MIRVSRNATARCGGAVSPRPRVWNTNRGFTSLRSQHLLKARYLAYVRTIAQRWLDWEVLGPIYQQYVSLIDQDVWEDTRKLGSYEQFIASAASEGGEGFGPRAARVGLKTYVDQRRDYLLSHPELTKPFPSIEEVSQPNTDGNRALAGRETHVTVKVSNDVPASSVWLHYCTEPAAPFVRVPMLDDGEHSDGDPGDGVYGGAIPGQAANAEVRYYVEARANKELGTVAFLPVNTEIGAYRFRVRLPPGDQSRVVISELMPANGRTVLQNGRRTSRLSKRLASPPPLTTPMAVPDRGCTRCNRFTD